ncbi:MAG: hypothetical protein HY665_00815 [Chloroflexi bacterium]|nr:hypothetical protein [Chloroflexota bacterium]
MVLPIEELLDAFNGFHMSCYFRHLKGVFDEAGITVVSSNRQQIDQAIHQFLGVAYKDCPVTWRHFKQEIMADKHKREELVAKLRMSVVKNG